MSQLLNFKRGVARLCMLRILVPEVENLRHIMPRKTAFALIFCSGASLLFGQEQSATALSHQVKDIFERAAKAVVKIHGIDEHSARCGTAVFIDRTGTLYPAYTVRGEAGNSHVESNGKTY